MSNFTPTPEAVEAALRTREFVAGAAFGIPADAMGQAVAAALTAAGPLIAAEARERVAREIEARVIRPCHDGCSLDEGDARWNLAVEHAARIARGEGS